MPDYLNFDPEALAADASFQRWQLFGNPADQVFWQQWLIEHPGQTEQVEKAVHLLHTLRSVYSPEAANNRAAIGEHEIREEISRLRESLDRPPVTVQWGRYAPVWYAAAASVLLVLGFFGWYISNRAANSRPAEKRGVTYPELVAAATKSEALLEVRNTTDTPLPVNLPDNSTIMLYPRSRVSYTPHFSGPNRVVYLSGKGFFDVKRNHAKPFFVYANSLVTKVLGTSFLVQAYDGATRMNVVVRTGRVSVFIQNGRVANGQSTNYRTDSTLLTPNQQVVFSTVKTQLTKSIVAAPVLLSAIAQQVTVFKRTPIADVFALLGQRYGIPIGFDADVMRDCYLTASFTDEPLFDQLDLICRTINADYQQTNGTIVINSAGCN